MKYKTRVVSSVISETTLKTSLVLYTIPREANPMVELDDIPEMRVKTSIESCCNSRTVYNQRYIKV